LFLLLIGIWALLAPVGSPDAAEPAGHVTRQEGTTFVLRGGQQATLALHAQLFIDDQILTGHDGRLVIEGPGGLRVVIGPGSELEVRRWLVEPQRGRLDALLGLVTGVLRLIASDDGERSVQVETRAAVASVRSTEWIIQATAANTGVFVIDGRVEVASPTGSVTVDPGLGTTVPLGGAPSTPAEWGAGRLAQVFAAVPAP
jgi:ferric-dicitrate binding protein FerR (iron transport regulator)